MKNHLLLISTVLSLLLFPAINFGQAPNLGTAGNFILFSTTGAVGNTGISQLTGNVGTNTGAITGFGNVNGVMHNTDGATAQAAIDLQAAWEYLEMLPPTAIHGPVLGNGETLYPGVDTIYAAGSIVGVLNLDAQGDPSAVFIFKVGGALTTAASATVNLLNGALACNVFWITKGGAISLAASTSMKGTLIAHPGAIDTGDGCTLEGRALSTTGAVTVYGTLAYIPLGCTRPILTGPLAPDLGPLECFALFSSNGFVSNSGITNIAGDIGTNNGSTTGYDPLLVDGAIHLGPDVYTAQGATAFPYVSAYLDTVAYDIELLYPAQLGNNLVLTPHTYLMNAAAAFTNILYLNAEGNADAIFVIRVNGALTTSANSEVRLINGTKAKNVYWKVSGAVTINSNSTFCGTIVNSGAITLNTGVILNGRALTGTGAIVTSAITADKGPGCSFLILPTGLSSFTGTCGEEAVMLKWTTSGEIHNGYYSIERSRDEINWQMLGMIDAINLSGQRNYGFTDKTPYEVSYYRLKLSNPDGKSQHFRTIMVKRCSEDLTELTVYPNPSTGVFNLLFKGDNGKVHSVSIYNASGEKVYHSAGCLSAIDMSGKADGFYVLHLNLTSSLVIKKLMFKK
ncbi:MAG: ice-binding family protein [Chitinophagaceae bacterium]